MDQKVEMVDSVDKFKSSRSIEEKDFPKFEMLEARIASAWNKIIQNSHFKKKVSLEEQRLTMKIGFFGEDRSLTSSTITFELLVLMIPFLIMLIFHYRSSKRWCSGLRYEMGV